MPELIEVEYYRQLAEQVVGRTIIGADLPDTWYVKGAPPELVAAAVVGCRVVGARRRGKLLLLDLSDPPPVGSAAIAAAVPVGAAPDRAGPTLGLRFGMTGRLIVDGTAGIDELRYGSVRDEPAWDRATLSFDGGGVLVMRDPRRLGSVELDPDEGRLGTDAASITERRLRVAIAGSRAPLKAALLDQARIAGLGNLLVDEILWRAGLSPLRPAGGLEPSELARLASTIRSTVRLLTRRGGSHTGDLMEHRRAGGLCPRDGGPLQRDTAGGRTTWWCPQHQH